MTATTERMTERERQMCDTIKARTLDAIFAEYRRDLRYGTDPIVVDTWSDIYTFRESWNLYMRWREYANPRGLYVIAGYETREIRLTLRELPGQRPGDGFKQDFSRGRHYDAGVPVWAKKTPVRPGWLYGASGMLQHAAG